MGQETATQRSSMGPVEESGVFGQEGQSNDWNALGMGDSSYLKTQRNTVSKQNYLTLNISSQESTRFDHNLPSGVYCRRAPPTYKRREQG